MKKIYHFSLVFLGINFFLTSSLESFYEIDPCFWFKTEYLFWFTKDSPVPVPLIVESPTVIEKSPLFGQPGTSVILGDQDVSIDARSGLNFSVGAWLNKSLLLGTELSYFYLQNGSKKQQVSSDGKLGSPFLGVPFIDIRTGLESSTSIALPGSFAGKAQLTLSNFMQGGEWNYLYQFRYCEKYDVKMMGGLRYWNFNEDLIFETSSPSIEPPIDIFKTRDRFRTTNQYYSGQVGIDVKYDYCNYFVNAKAKIALGLMREHLSIKGKLTTNDFNNFTDTIIYPGGYFALPTNIGNYKRSYFAALPEFNINLGYNITSQLNVSIGYNFLCVSQVLRPGNCIDRTINPSQGPVFTGIPSTQLVGPIRPYALFNQTDFWVQGLTVELEFKY